jgi:hypothetical protein
VKREKKYEKQKKKIKGVVSEVSFDVATDQTRQDKARQDKARQYLERNKDTQTKTKHWKSHDLDSADQNMLDLIKKTQHKVCTKQGKDTIQTMREQWIQYTYTNILMI